MLRAMITPLTMYNLDNSVFDGITLPARPFTDRGYEDLFLTGWDMDKTVFINNLLLETAELNVLYTDPVFFKFAVTEWAKKERPVWQSLYETIFFKYNPIWNKDGTIKNTAQEVRDLVNEHEGTAEDDNVTTTKGDNTIKGVQHDNTHSFEQIDGEERKTGDDTTTITYGSKDSLEIKYGSGDTVTTTYGSKIEKKNDNTTTGSKHVETNETDTPGEAITTQNQVSAFDTPSYSDREKTIENHSGTNKKQIITDETYNNFKNSDDGSEEKTGQDKVETTRDGTDEHTTEKTGQDTNKIVYDTKIVRGHDDTLDADIWKTNDERTDTNNRIEEKNKSKNGLKIEDKGTIEHTNNTIEQGNIGVTTTQQMIEAERELVRFNIYDVIIESFKQRFCLLIY